MLEGLVAWVLNNYLGKYVENLNTHQLSIALLQGEVELENLPLKREALRHVGLPVQVRAGFIGKVKLQIPVRQIRSAPWVIVIEQLYVVAGPYRLSEWDEETEQQACQEYKLGLLDELEARWRAETETPAESSYYASSYSSWLSYGTGLVTNIVENLQLKVKDVHLRYEDDETIPGLIFALGVTIGSLTAQSCDDKWMPCFTNWDTSGMSYKLLELNTLAVYWDSLSAEQLLGGLALGELAVAMSQCATQVHQFVLAPTSAQAHVKRNRCEQPLRSRSQPRIACDLHLEEVPLSLTDWQYGQMVGCLKGLQHIEQVRRFRKWRPDCTVTENPRAWWMYAIRCRIPHWCHSRQTEDEKWLQTLQRAKDNVAYVELYSRILGNPTASLPPSTKMFKDTMELERGFEELRSLRECAMRKMQQAKLPKDLGNGNPGRGLLLQWFPQWWGWYSPSCTTADTSDTPTSPSAAQPEVEQLLSQTDLEDQILDALADSIENNTLLRRDTIFGQFNFTLKKGVFNLCTAKNGDLLQTSEKVPLIELQFESVQLGWESRPRAGSHKFHLVLGAMYLHDHLTEGSVFPVLIAPQSRESAPSSLGRPSRGISPGIAKLLGLGAIHVKSDEPLFKLTYEFRPFHSNVDYRLHICSQSLDVVYNPTAVKWLVDFFTRPHHKPDSQLRMAARHRYEIMKQRTKEELMKNWSQILDGDLIDRKVWDIELDISAPQIILVEHFCDKNSLIVVVDFGKFHFSNQTDIETLMSNIQMKDNEEEEEDEFQTPCSTPPGSEASELEVQTFLSASQTSNDLMNSFTEQDLHKKLYDRYNMELCDMQILVGRVRDNWKFAHLKGTSTLHILDRFNISLLVERRVVFMSDPLFPSLRLTGNLPKLVVHINEQKVDALRTMATIIKGTGLPSPFRSPHVPHQGLGAAVSEADVSSSSDIHDRSGREMARLLILQFSVDQMALEMQSRGRSVAELQVSGVRAAYTKRPYDTTILLSVHSLLLVDALQTFGPDFELLVASHKHVCMDSVSGSLRDSEPTSPTSPGSPDLVMPRAMKATSPVALTQALSNLQTEPTSSHRALSPTWTTPSSPPYPQSPLAHPISGHSVPLVLEVHDTEALITIEICMVNANCPSVELEGEALQTASIQFNNLDIIANQETIVELVGFARRVFPQLKPGNKKPGPPASNPLTTYSPKLEADPTFGQWPGVPTRTELTFDFQRLNVLLLRAVIKDGVVVGRKIATATMSEAMIQATVGKNMTVQGSLGGLQVLDLTPEGQLHQRILSLGKDPLVPRNIDLMNCLSAELYTMGQSTPLQEDPRAFSFSVCRNLDSLLEDFADVKVRMASVWYTHSPQLVLELQSCASEFKQYLSNLARSIRSAATEMAIGLVHARAEALAQSLYINSRLSSSFYGSTLSDISSPKRRRRSTSQSSEFLDGIGSTRGTTPHTPYSPSDEELMESFIDVRLDIVLDSPVVVLPRSPSSTQVFVAHLGKISVCNSCINGDLNGEELWTSGHHESHNIEIRNMNLYSLDIKSHNIRQPLHSTHLVMECPLARAENLYSCKEYGKPILHDTLIRLCVDREIGRSLMKQSDNVLMSQDCATDFSEVEQHDSVHITGRVETPLKVSLSRQQYEQLLDTLDSLMTKRHLEDVAPPTVRRLGNIEEEEEVVAEIHTGVSTLNMDPALRAKMRNVATGKQRHDGHHILVLRVLFDLPVFTVELKGDMGSGERGLVDLSFQDFSVKYDHIENQETTIQMSLRSLMMEDLTREPESKHRCIVTSSAVPESDRNASARRSAFISKSCPDIHKTYPPFDMWTSLPNYLVTESVFGTPQTQRVPSVKSATRPNVVEYPCTPPPSPRISRSPSVVYSQDNLVHINVEVVPDSDNSNSVRRSVNVDFNSLDIVVNMESWVVVLDFFGIGSTSQTSDDRRDGSQQVPVTETESVKQDIMNVNSETYVKVRSLTLVFNRAEYEVARANISHLVTRVCSCDSETSIEGRLGSMSLLDLSPHGQLYQERFVSSGKEALNFHMIRYHKQDPHHKRDHDARLKLEMSSVVYVHTRRFVCEILAFINRFSQLQGVMASIRSAAAGYKVPQQQMRSTCLLLDVSAGSPVILLPLSSRSTDILVMDLGKLTVSNCFKLSGSDGTNTAMHKKTAAADVPPETNFSTETLLAPCLLDVMQVDLMNMDLYAGQRVASINQQQTGALQVGSFSVSKHGPPLLREKCHLRLQVDRNLETYRTHHVPDVSVKGTLSALHIALDVAQYKLIRGLLTYNLGESIEDLEQDYYSLSFAGGNSENGQQTSPGPVWSMTSITLDLVNVMLKLQFQHASETSPESSLAGINFIKSRLMVEMFSDGSRDIDLISQEFLITDTRFQAEPANRRSNVFTNILQPINMASQKKEVQAEVHHRRYHGYSKFTILLKDMRLMVILDWWEAVRNFIMEQGYGPNNGEEEDSPHFQHFTVFPKPSTLASSVGIMTKCPPILDVEKAALELKLNITSSEVVFVQDTSLWDTNAVILKSNSVILYRPQLVDKPLSCDLNNCEVFSCILGMEDETALSIVDPVLLSIEVLRRPSITSSRGIADAMTSAADRVLEVHAKDLTVRLSYHDMCMFMDILKSLPNQTLWARSQDSGDNGQPVNIKNQVSKLSALGFNLQDCLTALKHCNGLDDAALWLLQNAVPTDPSAHLEVSPHEDSAISFESIFVETNCVCVVVIDDCRDADVPLLELSLSRLQVLQKLGGPGNATCQLSCDYFNRDLSGWEPFIEPWGCEVNWQQTSLGLTWNTAELVVSSADLLNINITSTLVDLYKTVKENWTMDYDSLVSRDRCDSGSSTQIGSPPGYRRRQPFVPYALCNNTGSRLWFTTHITNSDYVSEHPVTALVVNENWVSVPSGATVPFTFEGRGKMRHRNTHKQNIHQLCVKVEGWCPVTPVSVDKVGIYFRQARPENQFTVHIGVPYGRIVFEVTLEGSAKKLVTVRSALLLCNRLPEPVELKLENSSSLSGGDSGTKCLQVPSSSVLPIPLSHVLAVMWVRPLDKAHPSRKWYQFSNKAVDWSQVARPGEVIEEPRLCHSNRDRPYRFSVAIRRENYPLERIPGLPSSQPAHTITLLSPITIINLLPHDLHYTTKDPTCEGRIRPGQFTALQQVDMEKPVEINFHLENYAGGGSPILIPLSTTSFIAQIRIYDSKGRRLLLRATVVVRKGAGLKVLVSAPYWIVNKTGLPLVFRQDGLQTEAAGQDDEHEVARMVAPLLFSYEEHEVRPSLVARVGSSLHPEGFAQWSKNFSLYKTIQPLQLRVSMRDNRPDIVYEVGISVRRGRGRYCCTSIVTLMPRFQLHNKSSYQLQFSQRCFATTLNDPGARATYLTAVPDCCLPFHWPRLDKDQLLCVRILDVHDCAWSGGFLINANNSIYINVRDSGGRMFFLRAEVVLQGATFFIVFTDADTMPPPLRVDNLSAVPLQFYQSCITNEGLQVTVRPNTSVPYALDEPTQPAVISVQAPGGATASYDMNTIGEGRGLTYENFIYIAFTGTFSNVSVDDPLDVHCQQLVLDVPQGSTKVILARKEQGKRSQLWRMTGDGHLQHEGSSPPRDPRTKSTTVSDSTMVLDIAAPALQPLHYVNLELRRPDRRRKSTQTWRFTEDGRLCCAHNNMCVQAKDGFFGLHRGVAGLGSSWQTWSEAVLGPPQPMYQQRPTTGVPMEQAVSRQRLRPGSGFLAVRVITDGPTAVLQITDLKETVLPAAPLVWPQILTEDQEWPVPMSPRTIISQPAAIDPRELKVRVTLPAGVGISLVSRSPPEELLYAHLIDINVEGSKSSNQQYLMIQVRDIQVDNQLFEAQCPVIVSVCPPARRDEDDNGFTPALELNAEKLASPNENVEIFKHLIIRVKNLSVIIEERLLLKLFAFLGYSYKSVECEAMEESDVEMQRIVTEVASVHAKRYYFGSLCLEPSQVRLSVVTSSKLPPQLLAIKRKLNLTLIKFEDAAVDLKPFIRIHPFESSQFLIHSIIKHFKDELKWQAAIILGSVDFLGNPLGLVNDVSEGMSGLIFEGNVAALLKNVTHGLSNSAAKVTESLSDGLGRVIMDDQHEETRQRIRAVHTSSSGDHLVAGLKGLGFGLLGGVTSVFRQTYEGATNEGMQGFISGLGKGLVGTVTKPVVGVLDLASEAASAVRDSSRTSNRITRRRFRAPRCVPGMNGLLPPYDMKQSKGQELLYIINEHEYTELLIFYECLVAGPDGLRILISTEMVRVFTVGSSGSCSIVLQEQLSELEVCTLHQQSSSSSASVVHYIELNRHDRARRPRVRCDTGEIAMRVCHCINYAKGMFEERRHTVLPIGDNIVED